jgi:hypothetical protein
MNLFSEDRHASARARARPCGPRTGRAGKVGRKGIDRMCRRERHATCRGTRAALGPVPHIRNDHPARPETQMRQRETPPDSFAHGIRRAPRPVQFPVIRPEGISAGQSERASTRGVAPYRRPAPLRPEPVAADVPDARIRQHRNTYRQRFFLTGRDGGLQGGLRRHARQNSLCSRSVRAAGRFWELWAKVGDGMKG